MDSNGLHSQDYFQRKLIFVSDNKTAAMRFLYGVFKHIMILNTNIVKVNYL
ncbi:hypothetical protein FD08_GL003634 [Lentilactobacillus parakefiri DSM 10551]|nr:hypothetical protein FD08_GL003634 [Lentilactobacillus parakefiri DSM 10551]